MQHNNSLSSPTCRNPSSSTSADHERNAAAHRWRSPIRGEHTTEVLEQHGYSAEEIAGLRKAGAFGHHQRKTRTTQGRREIYRTQATPATATAIIAVHISKQCLRRRCKPSRPVCPGARAACRHAACRMRRRPAAATGDQGPRLATGDRRPLPATSRFTPVQHSHQTRMTALEQPQLGLRPSTSAMASRDSGWLLHLRVHPLLLQPAVLVDLQRCSVLPPCLNDPNPRCPSSFSSSGGAA